MTSETTSNGLTHIWLIWCITIIYSIWLQEGPGGHLPDRVMYGMDHLELPRQQILQRLKKIWAFAY